MSASSQLDLFGEAPARIAPEARPFAPPGLYCPPDVETSYRQFGTSCGHAAIAALMGCKVADIARVQPKPYTSPSAAEEALRALGAAPVKHIPRETGRATRWPSRGLVIVQKTGPWTRPEVPIAAAYRHLHCIATVRITGLGTWVYDHNVEPSDLAAANLGVLGEEYGGWLLQEMWQRLVMEPLVAETKRATGWYPRVSFEVPERRSP